MRKKEKNRQKIVLAEQNRTNKWLAEQMGKNIATVSRWCTFEMQPSLDTLVKIADVSKIDVKELIFSTSTKKGEL